MRRRYPATVAAAIVIANMIGTGVFTSLGFQLVDIQSTPVLMMLWILGGLLALSGALSYAELGAALPRSGGEYHFLSEIYHPAAGFISGWVSATVGFAAPTALAAMTFGRYLAAVVPGASPIWLATILLLLLGLMHSRSRSQSGQVQTLFTFLKLLLIAGFSLCAFFLADPVEQPVAISDASSPELLFSGAFAVSLIYVSYAYSGWNAATYIAGEVDNPQRSLPVVLGVSTSVVALLYVVLNYTFLWVAPIDAMVGKVEVGYVAATYAFGDTAATIMGVLMSLLLVSTVSAMVIAGPRVLQRIGEDFALFSPLAKVNREGIPQIAVWVQVGIALLFVWTASFDQVLVLSGATMALNTLVTVVGLFVLRVGRPELPRPYRVWLYPVTPALFVVITGWTLVYLCVQRPLEILVCGGIVVAGLALYLLSRRLQR